MIHLLDTNILIDLIKRQPPQVNVREFRRIEGPHFSGRYV